MRNGPIAEPLAGDEDFVIPLNLLHAPGKRISAMRCVPMEGRVVLDLDDGTELQLYPSPVQVRAVTG